MNRLSKAEKQALKQIKESLNENFKSVKFKQIEDVPDFADLLASSYLFEAKIDEENIIHLKIQNFNEIIFSGTTNNYLWFVKNVYLK